MCHQTSIFMLLAISGSACAVFYTKSTDNDYPRIGRRTFYTAASGAHYPRIGRRDATGSHLLLPGLDLSEMSTFEKRGVFTQSAHGSYPRVGRGSEESTSQEDYPSSRSSQFLDPIVGMKEDMEESNSSKEGSSKQESRNLHVPFDIMFSVFDVDGDRQLSKDEFSAGFTKYRQHGSVC